MVQFNFSERTIKAKVVYYGPAQSGKTTNLEQVHRLTDPSRQNRLISLNTAQDRTLFFDLLPFSLGAVSGYDFKVQLYTVPGQVQYNATRRVVLAGADAVVFVADARKSAFKENLQAFENMKVNLLANRLVPEKVPVVFQFNKQDLPDLQTVVELNRTLNPWGRRAFPAVAAQGQGVLETFVAVVQEMLTAIAVKYNLKEKGLDPASVPEVVGQAFSSLLAKVSEEAPPLDVPQGPSRVVVSQATDSERAAPLQGSSETGQVSEELLHRAIRSNVELAEALSELVRDMNMGLATIASQAELLQIYREDAREKRTAAVQIIHTEANRLRKIVQNLGKVPPGPAPPAEAPPPQPPPPPRAPEPPPPSALKRALLEGLSEARGALEVRDIVVNLQVPEREVPPRGTPEALRRTVSLLLTGTAALSVPGSAAVLRCERKPVLLKSRDGQQVKKDFLMLALSHGVEFPPETQQRIAQGAEPGPLGEMGRAVREGGGFVRFAPLPGGQ
ncbi:MAG TPA: GTPase domain-containing protein, partial [Vicinamibacteria bacterium]|nr:GTPase domain-containing protein [Vicinamibacteria bacterium]